MPNSAGTLSGNSAERMRKTKSGGVSTKMPHQVLRRNERERKRVQQVNLGFIHLRDRVPQSSSSKKLSKVETLREAARYIKHLQDVLRLSCDKQFDPIEAEPESPSYQNPSTSQENFYPPPPAAECIYQSQPYDQQYYQAYTPVSYYKPPFGASFAVVKSEETSPDSSCTSENSVDVYRFQQKNYIP